VTPQNCVFNRFINSLHNAPGEIAGQQWVSNLNFCSNSACSRLSSAIKVLNEFYRIAFRRKIYRSIKELQADLDAWMAATTTNVRIRSVGAY
jgi:hypothetical protein